MGDFFDVADRAVSQVLVARANGDNMAVIGILDRVPESAREYVMSLVEAVEEEREEATRRQLRLSVVTYVTVILCGIAAALNLLQAFFYLLKLASTWPPLL